MKHIKLFEAYLVNEEDEILYHEISDDKQLNDVYDGPNDINKKTIKKLENYISSQKKLEKFELTIDYDALHPDSKGEDRPDTLFILSNEKDHHKNYLIKEYDDSWFTVLVSILDLRFDVLFRKTFRCDGLAGVYQLISKWEDFKVEEKEEE